MLDIVEMLRYRRPAGSKTERDFIARYIDVIDGVYADHYGNRLYIHPTSRVLISCHTDTVHRMEGKQRVRARNGVITLGKRSGSNCLGADDTAGIYAALRMIESNTPVSVIFHRAEEIGGLGSQWLADHYPEWFAQRFDVCLALDRRGTSDIITEQWCGTCCSDAFAVSLSEQLGMGHKPARGSFTDSANYANLIPECSNLSIGYQCEHSPMECLNVDYLERITGRLTTTDWSALSIARNPDSIDSDDYSEYLTWETGKDYTNVDDDYSHLCRNL